MAARALDGVRHGGIRARPEVDRAGQAGGVRELAREVLARHEGTVDQRNWITWQGGDPSCVSATPTQNRTWGSVKSLYR